MNGKGVLDHVAAADGAPTAAWQGWAGAAAKSPVPLAAVEFDGRFDYANQAFEALVLKSLDTLRDRKITTLWALDEYFGEPQTLLATLRTEGATTIVAEPARKTKNIPPVLLRLVLLGDTDTMPAQVGVTVVERTVAEHARDVSRAVDGLRLTFDQLEVGMFILSLEGRIIDVNRKLCQLLGRSSDEFKATEPFTLVHPDDRSRDIANAVRAFGGEIDAWSGEKRMLHADGSVIWVLETVTLVRGERGEPIQFVTQVIDISHQKETEEALRDNEARFTFLADGMSIGIVEIDRRGTIASANRALRDIVGRNAVGLAVAEIIHPVDLDVLTDNFAVVLGLDHDLQNEFRIVRRDGAVRWVRGNTRFHRNEAGQFMGAISALTDITDEVAAREASDRYAQLHEASDDIIALALPTGEIEHLNRTGRALLGDEPDEGSFLHDLFTNDDRKRFAQFSLPSVIRDGSWSGELSLKAEPGREHFASVSLVGHPDADGRIEHVTMITRDVTHLKEIERRLREQATIDVLTGIPNRATFFDRLEHAIARLDRRDEGFVVLLIDLHGFHGVNEEYGEEAADEILIVTARRIREAVRMGDTVARIGGDEFAVLAEPMKSVDDAIAIGEKIVEAMGAPFETVSGLVPVGVNIGIAASGQFTSARTLVNAADLAVYSARANGVGSIVVADFDTST